MSDEHQPPVESAPKVEPTSQAAPTVPPVDTSAVAKDAAKAAADAVLAQQKKDAAAADRAAAKAAEKQAQADALKAANDTAAAAQASAEKYEKAAKRQAALAALPGLQDADTFLPLVMDDVQFGDDGALTEESAAALAKFREEKPYLFKDSEKGPIGTTPTASGGHKIPQGQFSPEERRDLTFSKVALPGDKANWRNHPTANSPAVTLGFGNLLKQANG